MEEIEYCRWLNKGRIIDINCGSKKDRLLSDHCRFRKGQKVLYEGREAEIIAVKPLLIIKANDRIICGALHSKIEFM